MQYRLKCLVCEEEVIMEFFEYLQRFYNEGHDNYRCLECAVVFNQDVDSDDTGDV